MDLFDQLKTAGAVAKEHKKDKEEKKKNHSDSNKNVETPKKNNSLKHDSKDSVDKHNSSFEKKKEKHKHSHEKSEETPSKKNSLHDKSKSSSPEKTTSKHHKEEKEGKKKSHDGKTKHDNGPLKNGKENSHGPDDNDSPPKKKSKVDVTSKESENKSKTSSGNHEKNVEKFNKQHKTEDIAGNQRRRESLPSPIPPLNATKKKANKSRSLSPPKSIPPAFAKQLKVKLERTKLEDYSPVKGDNLGSPVKTEELKKKTPTKAQQKLFEPSIGQKKSKKKLKVKRCVVRIHRDNLKKLMKEFKKSTAHTPTGANKQDGSPSTKKGKPNATALPKTKTGFFIKITTPSKTEKKSKLSKSNSSSSSSSSSSSFSKSSSLSSSTVAQHNKIKNSKSSTTTPTKFSRTHLIKTFGKQWFNCHVRVKKCNHPIAQTFVSKSRARHQLTNKSKRKNLSVSFRDEVEVLGTSSDSDSDDSRDENFCATAIPANLGSTPVRNSSRRSSTLNAPLIVPTTPLPARLKKLENGRVVDDIVLDPSLFLGPENIIASTPFSPGRKKREHKKSFSPLKDEEAQSPRKEQLKRANERVPPTGLRRLNIDDDDEDDEEEDDDCEYIVPIDMPERRASRTSSTNTACDTGPSVIPPTFDDDVVPYTSSSIFTQIDEAITLAKGLVSPVTATTPNPDSNENKLNDNDNNNKITTNNSNNTSDNTESHDSFVSAKNQPDESLSPPLFNDAAANLESANAAPGVPPQTKSAATTNDSQTNEDAPEKNYVDNIINELGSDIGNDDSSAM
ncbi:probable replication factor C subunit 1 isoform X2 [Musca domestica]|uniref:Serine/arginine repetitive matrix protein 2 isoform X2 n=1 Tax=Musca domestica TaxID=7370 RepID=A0A1I8N7Y1_MUSDO|nr:probable replication factor C subunit 1 isoform X2 [Musca domestica]